MPMNPSTTKSVIFFRHGKSDWNAAFGSDHERPINQRGHRDSLRMGRFLADAENVPDRVVTSSALRARQTLERAVEGGKWGEVSTRVTDDLYEASPEAVLSVIRMQDNTLERLLLVGHEPTWSSMISLFIGGGAVKVSTATMARIDFMVPRWKDVAFGRGTLRWFVPPKLLR